jgi:hypothetical protein
MMVKKKRTKKEIQETEIQKLRIIWGAFVMGAILILGIIAVNLSADTITFKFKSPSFSGVGTSSHYLTIDSQTHTREMTIKEELKALQDQIKRDKENTTLARFIRSLESRIYAKIAQQIVNNMFGESQSTEGTFELEGNIISYKIEDGMITLTVVDADGNETIIQLPLGDFSF